MALLFIYGTLKRGGSNHGLMAGQHFAGAAKTTAEFRLYELGGFPGMVRAGIGGNAIEGELWEVDEECLGRLDRLEGTAERLYERATIQLEGGDAHQPRPGPAVTYLYLRSVEGREDLGVSYDVRKPS